MKPILTAFASGLLLLGSSGIVRAQVPSAASQSDHLALAKKDLLAERGEKSELARKLREKQAKRKKQ